MDNQSIKFSLVTIICIYKYSNYHSNDLISYNPITFQFDALPPNTPNDNESQYLRVRNESKWNLNENKSQTNRSLEIRVEKWIARMLALRILSIHLHPRVAEDELV